MKEKLAENFRGNIDVMHVTKVEKSTMCIFL